MIRLMTLYRARGLRKVAVAAAPLLGLLVGCSTAGLPDPVRAIWVTRYDYESPMDVERIMDDCADAGFNTVLFQVRGNGTAFYNSPFEPWADELGGRDPGWDPLTTACDAAHDRGISLHAWVNVMPAWHGKRPPANPEQLYNKHPDWFWYDQNGKRQALSSFYVSLNPALPEVRDYLTEVFADIVARYDVDGLHMDYIRFPNEPPATPRRSGLDYPRDERTLAMYKEQTGLTPDADEESWDRWRTAQVTRLVRQIRARLRATKPRVGLTAAVGSVRERALHHFQDGRAWLQEGLIDAALLMNYTDDPDQFIERIEPWLELETKGRVVPGLWFGRHPDKSIDDAARTVCRQIELARERTGDFCIFAYSSLFESPDEKLVRRDEEQRTRRAARRTILLPSLREMRAADS